MVGILDSGKSFLFANFTILVYLLIKRLTYHHLQHISILFSFLQIAICFFLYIDDFAAFLGILNSSSKLYTGIFLNPNLTSHVLVLLIPISVFGIINPINKRLKAFQIFGLFLSALTLYFLASKASFMSLAFALIITLMLSAFLKKSRIYKVLIILIAFLSISIGLSYGIPKLKSQVSFQHRIELWNRTINTILESPILGTGLGTWRVENLKHVPSKASLNIEGANQSLYTETGNIFYERPHNDFLWVWSEIGIIGLLVYLSLIHI